MKNAEIILQFLFAMSASRCHALARAIVEFRKALKRRPKKLPVSSSQSRDRSAEPHEDSFSI
jgi:hypothetical protein